MSDDHDDVPEEIPWYTASCWCGFTTNRYGTQEVADQALAAHQHHLGH